MGVELIQDVEVTMDVDVVCDVCGTNLSTNYNKRYRTLRITPCEVCMEKDEE